MSYRLETDETVAEGIRRIAHEQLDKALHQLDDRPEGDDEAVHDARKRCKKIRALLRFVRDTIGEEKYQDGNTWYRDAARQLAPARDAWVRVETLDRIADHYGAVLADDAFAPLRRHLVDRYEEVTKELVREQDALVQVTETLRRGGERIDGWPIDEDGFDAFEDGLGRIYERGRKAMKKARKRPTPERIHEWRKRVKYLWYSSRLLETIWPPLMEALEEELHHLSNLLGDEHDFAVLAAYLEDQEGDDDLRRAAVALCHGRRRVLREEAWPLGEKIYAESKGDFLDRIETLWESR